MPALPPMTREEREAYDEALQRIEAWQQRGNADVRLDLAELGLTHLPPEIGQLTALTGLDLSNNPLTTLPPEIGTLAALTKLYLYDNQLTTLPPEIGKLSALKELVLYNNQLTTLPPEIGKLTALTRLVLWNNQLTTLPPEIGQLAALKYLDLSNNQLTTLPPQIGQLAALTGLYLSNNQLTTLPPEIGQLSALKELFLHDNPGLGIPPSVLGPEIQDTKQYGGKLDPAPPAEILDYYFSSRGSAGRALREVKVILVGRGEVGKSSMADVLQSRKFIKHRKRTDGIAISSWPVKLPDGEATLLLWDFGGQEIMHGTHQFFLTHRSLYVVMVDGRHDRGKQDAEYWLKLVRAFGGNSTALVVMNRQKAHPFDLDRQHLADKHGVKLEHFFRTDCERPKDIPPLRRAILDAAAQMLEQEERFPVKCWDVKTRLGEMKQHGEDYLSDEGYAAICREHGVEDAAEQQKLLKRLADLGTVVSFPDEMKLAELTVLNPEWVTDGIYRVITDEALCEEKHGQLTRAKLRSILPKERWPKPKHLQYLLDLMEKFELCFPVEGMEDTMLVPDLLPDVTPPLPGWDAAKCVVFQYCYQVLPHGVLPRFITRTHTLGGGRERWRSGVVLVDDGAEALIKADYEANVINVWVRGIYADARRALLKVVRHHFDAIHSRIKDLNPQEHVAVPGHPAVMVPYQDALQDERDRKVTYRVTIGGKRVDKAISELLNGVETRHERDKQHRLARRELGRDVYVAPGGHYHEHEEAMSTDSHDIIIHGNVSNSQVGQTLTNCTNMIQQQAPGEVKTLLTELEREVQALIAKLPADKHEEVAGNLELLVKAATSAKPNRAWYSVSSEGLLEAAKWVHDFTGNLTGTVGKLGKLLWP